MTRQKADYVLRFGGSLEVPVFGEDDAAEDTALAEHPGFLARLERARQNRADGKGIPAEEVDRYFQELEGKQRRGRPTGRRATGDSGNVRVRMPKKLHRELAEQAGREGVSLNSLIVTYLAREAGVRSAETR